MGASDDYVVVRLPGIEDPDHVAIATRGSSRTWWVPAMYLPGDLGKWAWNEARKRRCKMDTMVELALAHLRGSGLLDKPGRAPWRGDDHGNPAV